MEHVCANQLKVPLKPLLRRKRRITTVWASLDNSRYPNQQQEQKLNLSVLRFTLGIRGLDESYLPRWIGYAFSSLLMLNHFVGSTSPATPAQLRSECLGLSLGAFSVALPYLGKFLKGAILTDQVTIPEGNKQIFVMSEHLTEMLKEDLAWGTFVVLKNTNSMAVLISIQDALCIRGYWNVPEDASKGQMLDWFERQIRQIGLFDLKDTLYFPVSADSGLREVLPEGTRSLLVQPVIEEGQELSANEDTKKTRGFILLASSISYAYNDKDQAWIEAIARKFRDAFGLDSTISTLL